MAHVLALSSWVAHGHVGLSAAAPVLQALGHRVTQLPTVQLSNHAGFPHVVRQVTEVATLDDMVDALDANGWLGDVDAVLTGYMPGADHVAFAAHLIDHLASAASPPRIVVDPVLGDHPKGLYIPAAAASAVRDMLLSRADILTPNPFELSWLAGRPVQTRDDASAAAHQIAAASGGAQILVTSPPLDAGRTGVLAVSPKATALYATDRIADRDGVPHGVGDVFAALVAANLPVGMALGHLHALIGESIGAPHLRIAETASLWRAAKPIVAEILPPLTDTHEKRWGAPWPSTSS